MRRTARAQHKKIPKRNKSPRMASSNADGIASMDLGQIMTMVFAAPPVPASRRRRSKRTASNPDGMQTRSKKTRMPPVDNPCQDDYDQDELEYYMSLSWQERNDIASIEQRILDRMQVQVPLRFKILTSGADDHVKTIAMKKLETIYAMEESYPEYHKTIQWIEALCRLPIGVYAPLKVGPESPAQRKREFIVDTRRQLDNAVFGHGQAKQAVLRLLAQWVTKPDARGMVIGIHGPPGTGKTSLCIEGICKSLGLPFAFISLGGISDSSFLDGHSYTYEGSTWGRIADLLMKTKVSNPLLMFDELDKVSESHRGDEIINLLIHLTDPAQNDKFTDRYFGDLKIDLSRCLMVFSYNDESRISPVLRDRMFRIRTAGYSVADKIKIVHRHLLPDILSQHGFAAGEIVFPDELLHHIIGRVDAEDGVRNLKRALVAIVGDINLRRLMELDETPLPLRLAVSDVEAVLKTVCTALAAINHHMYV
jgi:ATP-dependent Lon protease